MAKELWAQQLGVEIGSRKILDGAELKVAAREMVVVTGPSGKTTLLLVMAGLQNPDRGQVLLDGEPLAQSGDLRRRIGVVLQNHGLVSVLTAAENVAIVLQARGVDRAEVTQRTAEVLSALGLSDHSDRRAVSASASAWPGLWSGPRRSCWLMSRPQSWTWSGVRKSSLCCASMPSAATSWSWLRTTKSWPIRPTALWRWWMVVPIRADLRAGTDARVHR